MPLDQKENSLASRFLLDTVRQANTAKKHADQAIEEASERRMGAVKVELSAVVGALRNIVAYLDDIRRALNLEDPKETQRKEFSDRLSNARKSLESAKQSKEKALKAGINDENIVASMQQAINRHEQTLEEVQQEMRLAGISAAEIQGME